MPWPTGKSFAARHNKKLRGGAATKAKRVAEGAMRSGVPEGEAIAIGNKAGNRMQFGIAEAGRRR